MLDRKLRQAAAALHSGDFAAAERLTREVLKRAPRNPVAMHLSAVVRLRHGDAMAARDLLRQVLDLDPHNGEASADLGVAELTAGDFREAESRLRRALALGKRDPATLTWLGIALASQNRHREAAGFFHEALATDSENPGLHLNLGNTLTQLGDFKGAQASIEKALSLRADYPEALNSLGTVLQEQGRPERAISAYRKAIAVNRNYAEAHNNLGNALLATSPEEAISCFERAIALRPDYTEAHYNLGNAFQGRRRFDAAVGSYRRVLELDPEHALAHHNLGNALLQQGRLDEAATCFERAIALKPDYLKAHSGLGAVRQEQGRFDEAVAWYERALTWDPQFPEAQYNLALVRLYRHEFDRAWPLYEQRFNCEGIRERIRKDSATVDLFERLPRWKGPQETVAGDVGIWAEQGIGDQVLFSTLIPDLIAAGATFLYEVDRRLLEAYQRAFPGQRFVAMSDPPQEALQQAHRALFSGSLPRLFRTSPADFARQPARLLSAVPERVRHYRCRLDAVGPGLKVAFSWRSEREGRLGARKSAPLVQFAPLFGLANVHFVDVQYGDTRAERQELERVTGVRPLRFDEVDYFQDLEELLAILEACDLLITTSNVNAHLAGALGKRVWLLYLADNPPFHYWVHDGSRRCLWYPSVEIVTSPQLVEWTPLITTTAEKLEQISPSPVHRS